MGRFNASVEVHKNSIYIVGGYKFTTENQVLPLNCTEVYDMATRVWSKLQARVNVAMDNIVMREIRGELHVFGGRYSKSVNGTKVWMLQKLQENKWITAYCFENLKYAEQRNFYTKECRGQPWLHTCECDINWILHKSLISLCFN